MWTACFLGLFAALSLVAAQPYVAPPTETKFVCNCPGKEAKAYICGVDGTTYGNECILNCINVPKKYDGACKSDGCFPYGNSKCDGNFDDHAPVCSNGITWDGVAEAQCSGTALTATCYSAGVCQHRADGRPAFLPTTGGKGLDVKIAANRTTLPAKTNPPYNYSEALAKLLLFYDSLISGNITAPGVCKRRRSDSCSSCKGKYGEDLSGGFFSGGGSTLKYPATISGFSATMLAWAGIEYGAAVERTGSLADLKWKVKWAADHVIAAHPEEFVFVGLIGNGTEDDHVFSPVEYYELFNPSPRIVGYVTAANPGSEIVADAAATIAAAVALLGDEADAQWKDSALTHAKQLYNFAKTYPGSYRDSKDPVIQMVQQNYFSNGQVADDLAWAATWMYKATGEAGYLADAGSFAAKMPAISEGETFETTDKRAGVGVLLSAITKNASHLAIAKTYFDTFLGMKVAHTKAGAAYPYHWGANRHVGNLGFLTLVHAKNDAVDAAYAARLVNYGMHQTNYLLGDAGRSWVVGFGKDWPTQIYHKFSYNSILTWNPNTTAEPLGQDMWMTDVRGPGLPIKLSGTVQKAAVDFEGSRLPYSHVPWGTVFAAPLFDDGLVNSRRDRSYTDPTIEYNAGAVGAIAALADWYSTAAYAGVESLDGVIPFTCDQPVTPFTTTSVAPYPPPSPGGDDDDDDDDIDDNPANGLETANLPSNEVDSSPSTPPPEKESSVPMAVVIGGAVGGVILVSAVAVGFVMWRKRAGQRVSHQQNISGPENGASSPRNYWGWVREPKFNVIAAAPAAAAAGRAEVIEVVSDPDSGTETQSVSSLALTAPSTLQVQRQPPASPFAGVGPSVPATASDASSFVHYSHQTVANLRAQQYLPGLIEAEHLNSTSPPVPPTRPEASLALSTLSSLQTSRDPVLQWIASNLAVDSLDSGNISDGSTTDASNAVPNSKQNSRARTSIPPHLASLAFKWDDVRVLKSLGIGSFGKVFLCELHHAPVAVKLLVDAKALATATAAGLGSAATATMASEALAVAPGDKLLAEVSIMAYLHHPNVAHLVGFCLEPPALALEYYARGSLFDVLGRAAQSPAAAAELTWARRIGMAADAAAGMLHLHTRSPAIIHRDLKSPNLLVCSDYSVKIGDVGLSKLLGEASQNSSSTAGGPSNPRWLAPEVINGSRHTAKTDVYAFGIIMWELLTWTLPWEDTTVWGIVGQLLNGGRPSLPPISQLPGFGPEGPPVESLERFIALMHRCWAQSSEERPGFDSIAAELRRMV